MAKPNSDTSTWTLLLLLLFVNFARAVQGYTISYEYNQDDPLRALGAGNAPIVPDPADSLDFHEWDIQAGPQVGSGSSQQLLDLDTQRLPTAMFYHAREGAAAVDVKKLSVAKRKQLYKRASSTSLSLDLLTTQSQLEGAFVMEFAYCVQAKMASACRRAMGLIRKPRMFGAPVLPAIHDGKKYDTVNGSRQKAKQMHELLDKHAEKLEQGAATHQAKP